MEGKVRPLRRSESPIEARLLRAGRSDEPPPGAMERAASVLGISGIVGTSAAGAQAAGLGIKALVGKWTLISSLSVGAAFGGWEAWQSAAPPKHETAALEAPKVERLSLEVPVGDLEPAVDETPSLSTDEVGVVAPGPTVAVVPATTRRTRPERDSKSVTLAEEVRMLDRARGALQRGRVTEAFSALNTYERSQSKRALDQEATLLRIEALVALGQRSKARKLAASLLADNPKSAHRKRLESLLGAF